ncbi:hypothetical+protein [Methylocapsa aurea]|uniref:hypothetical protein n=1 Tax=Methylocapsa aurea TaxID=663610 RepID=UPI003D18C115
MRTLSARFAAAARLARALIAATPQGGELRRLALSAAGALEEGREHAAVAEARAMRVAAPVERRPDGDVRDMRGVT